MLRCGTVNTKPRLAGVSTRGPVVQKRLSRNDLHARLRLSVLQSPTSLLNRLGKAEGLRLGLFPKISTPVENAVENPEFSRGWREKRDFSWFLSGESRKMAVIRLFFDDFHENHSMFMGITEAKVELLLGFSGR